MSMTGDSAQNPRLGSMSVTAMLRQQSGCNWNLGAVVGVSDEHEPHFVAPFRLDVHVDIFTLWQCTGHIPVAAGLDGCLQG